jgi:hypothetical protein
VPKRYHELAIEGPRHQGLGFVLGFMAGRGASGQIVNAEEEGFDCEPLRERIRELLNRSVETVHLLIPSRHIDLVREATTAAAEEGVGLTIVADRKVKEARFEFKLTIYSREHGERIRELFQELPDGVTMTTEEGFREEIRPGDDAELSGYAPVHPYALSAKGVIEGDVAGVLKLYRTCLAEDLIQTQPAQLVE